ncbi:MAG: adenylyl-sulfate kinase [Rhodospirillales bacterium]|nr:adenylyl-sulfate kinase [Rhodospirillales bacterium]
MNPRDPARQPPLPIVIVGHVDHGKSTLVGRLLHETGSLPDGRVEQIRADSRKRGMPFEWSFVMDALQVERDQGITVDTTQIWFSTAKRRYVIIDAPGHKEFLKNMVTGAAAAEAAVLVIDAQQGISEQTRRHAFLLHLLGISRVAIAVNKLDLVDYGEERFAAVEAGIRHYLDGLGIAPTAVIPVSARHGENIATAGGRTPWYAGPTVIEALDAFPDRAAPADQPLRFPVQDLYKFDERRLIVGRIAGGRLKVGDTLRFLPGGGEARIASIESWNRDTPQISAAAGQSVALTLDDEIFVERGHVAVHPDRPATATHAVTARLFWLAADTLTAGSRLSLRIGTADYEVAVEAIHRVIDSQDLGQAEADRIERNGVADVVLRSRAKMVVDAFAESPASGRGVLVRGHRIVGGCIIQGPAEVTTKENRNLTAVAHAVGGEERTRAYGHAAGVLWLTGLSGSGKSTLAMALERQLFDRGYGVYVLDGDNMRGGLCRDLGFSDGDRAENIRRVAETARLFVDAGFVVISAFISPSREDRNRAREIIGPGFNEVYVKAGLDVCEGRDPKGLYAKARAGEIASFTGISAPYEEPLVPDLTVDTADLSIHQSLARLTHYVENRFGRETALGATG